MLRIMQAEFPFTQLNKNTSSATYSIRYTQIFQLCSPRTLDNVFFPKRILYFFLAIRRISNEKQLQEPNGWKRKTPHSFPDFKLLFFCRLIFISIYFIFTHSGLRKRNRDCSRVFDCSRTILLTYFPASHRCGEKRNHN